MVVLWAFNAMVLALLLFSMVRSAAFLFGWRCSPQALQRAEDATLALVVKTATCTHRWLEVETCAGVCHLHALVAVSPEAGPVKEALVLVHGTAGSSVGFSPLLDRLTKTYEVHCLDLPGFGKGLAPATFRRAEREAQVQGYCQCIKAYMEHMEIQQANLVAHSFGGFIATHFVAAHPELVSRLLLVNSAGIFPTLGATGAYWAVFFKLSLPQSVLRILGMPGLVHAYLRAVNASAFAHYYYQLLASPDAFGDTLVGRFITVGLLQASWDSPTLTTLLSTPVPLAFVYGADDDIMPAHQAEAVIRASGAPIPLCIVESAGHAPYADQPAAFCDALGTACLHACAPVQRGTARDACSATMLSAFKSSYNVRVTSATIDSMYKAVLAACGVDPSAELAKKFTF